MRLGVVGSGDSGASFAGAAHHVPGVELVGVAGRTREKVAALAQKYLTKPFTFEQLLAEKPDCVAIATPPGVHSAAALACIERGMHVMIEKPMALAVEDCDRVIAAALKRNVRIMVTQTFRYRDISRKARELILSGRFGAVTHVAINLPHNYFTGKRSGWQLDPELSGGGVTMNPFIHMLDLARYLAGAEVRDFHGHIGFRKPGYKKIDSDVVCLLEFVGDATAMIAVNGLGVLTEEAMDVYLTGGVLRIRPLEKRIDVLLAGRIAECHGVGENGVTNAQGIYGFLGYVHHIEEMLAAVEQGGPISSDGANGRENVRVARCLLERAGVSMPPPTLLPRDA